VLGVGEDFVECAEAPPVAALEGFAGSDWVGDERGEEGGVIGVAFPRVRGRRKRW
jgi:hypothetical protein